MRYELLGLFAVETQVYGEEARELVTAGACVASVVGLFYVPG